MTDEEAVRLLLDLVSIPSVTGSESAAVEFMTETMRQNGLSADTDAVGNGIARTTVAPSRLMFLGHIDTVPGEIEPRIESGRIYGRGAVDAKGPLATAMVAAIRAKDTAGIEIIGAVGEEGPSHGARLLTKQPAPHGLIIGEPGGSDSIVLGYKGSMRATLRFSQPLTHTAGPEAMVCDVAVDAWTRVRSVCSELSQGEAAFDQLTPALLGFEAESDGLTTEAHLNAGFRLPPDLDIGSTQTRIREAALPGEVTFAEADPAIRAPKDTSLVASFMRAIRAQEIRPRFKVKTGTSDMNVVAPVWRCPTVAYGPGDSSLDHTPNEHIAIDEYLRGIRVLTEVFKEWASLMLVIKLGGSAGIDVNSFLDDLATVTEPFVLVHGANAELDALSRKLGIEPKLVTSTDGQVSRFTDPETMDLFFMVYAGRVNKRIVEGLMRRGRRAVGLTGLDGGIVTGRRKEAIRVVENGKPRVLRGDFAGSIETVDAQLLTMLLDSGLVPVICPPAVSHKGDAINVDGDKMAMEIAVALWAEKLLIFSNTAGLLADADDPDSLIRQASLDDLGDLLASARGRMKKKVLSCANALRRGVTEVILGDATVQQPVRRALGGEGTHFSADSSSMTTR